MLPLWSKAFHIIAMVAWFAGLFYLPRLFVYHADSVDPTTQQVFIRMEKKLYFYIMMPAMVLTLLFGGLTMGFAWQAYLTMAWMHAKLTLVLVLLLYHFYLGMCVKKFSAGRNIHSAKFYRWLNEVPTVVLVGVVILVVVKPF